MTAPTMRPDASSTSTLEDRLQREQSSLRLRSMSVVAFAVVGIVALLLAIGSLIWFCRRWEANTVPS